MGIALKQFHGFWSLRKQSSPLAAAGLRKGSDHA